MIERVVVPDAIEPIVGWRAWVVCRDTKSGAAHLRSVIRRGCIWPHRQPLEAVCIGVVPKHEDTDAVPPVDGCNCGIYAATSGKGVRPFLTSYWNDAITTNDVWRVFGRVSMWGRVEEGTLGWRAQVAYPHSLALPARSALFENQLSPDELEELAEELRAAYGVPVVVERDSIARRLLRR